MGKSSAKNGWASDAPTPAQLKELFAQIESGRITKVNLQQFLRGKLITKTIREVREEWQKFYKKYFGVDVDFSDIKITMPEDSIEFNYLMIVLERITLKQVYDACVKKFPCWRYVDDLDKVVSTNDRDSKSGSYAVWFRNRKEADKELKNLSADQLTKEGILGITLLERLLYELKFLDETGEHLDENNVTLCTGSRYADGNVPHVDWDGGKFRVHWDYSSSHDDSLRARAAVLCPPKAN